MHTVVWESATSSVRLQPENYCLVILVENPEPVPWTAERTWPVIGPRHIGDVDPAVREHWQTVRDVVAAHPDADGETLTQEISDALFYSPIIARLEKYLADKEG